MDVISETKCSIPGCIVSLLTFILPSSFSISHKSESAVKTVGETINEVAEQLPGIVSGLTSCLSLHAQGNLDPDSGNESSGSSTQENSQGSSDANNNEGVQESTPKPNNRKLFQGCVVM
ncbi:hypothetical protein T552_02826 [Pneumocystis carinii B80]|uniref:Uncharacterized protein n=1 Tax=Pneumocystis carinii (strain B80) TaxID=1408658 RepID=A0A0W4ZDD0_PNEC8|nr:hypothetical protein T552_02826 [Pneumocystis carinii B80]KTW26341.1 hypothetical protein T552_02826 [Pneumocystis carinii B80]